MKTFSANLEQRRSAINGLAIFGFVTLIVVGMWLAIYSTRFVPIVANRIGAAAVYIGSVFTPTPGASLSVVQTATSTVISFGAATTTATSTKSAVASTPEKKPVATTAGEQTNSAYQIGGPATGGILTGLPDLTVTITKVGYLATTSATSFVASSTIPTGSRPAVKFLIKNVGTNSTGTWYFSASIPTQSLFIYQSLAQQSLNPGDHIEYTLGFDQANRGAGKVITITANYNHAIAESNMNNDVASTTVTILGS